MRPDFSSVLVLALSRKARGVQMEELAFAGEPFSAASALEPMVHMTGDDGAEIPAAFDNAIDGHAKIGIAEIPLFGPKIASVNRIAPLAEACRPIVCEDNERERAIGAFKLFDDLRSALFERSDAVALLEVAREGEARAAKRMRSRCEHLEAELGANMKPISFAGHRREDRLDLPRAALLVARREKTRDAGLSRDFGKELRGPDAVVVSRDGDGGRAERADERTDSLGLLRPKAREVADKEQEIVAASVDRACLGRVELAVDISEDAEGCHRVGALLYTSSMRLLIVITMLAGLSPTQTNEGAMEEEAPECAKVRGEARYQGLGYTHFAIVKNECASALACELYSDVDPKSRHRALVPAGKTHEEALRRGSPASAFKLGYRCEARGALATP